jgi:hypothetical protein
MHTSIIDFNLEGISEEDYRGQAETVAPAFASLPGLVSKTWLANRQTNTYGGVYVRRDREAMEDYKESGIYKGPVANPYFGGVSIRNVAVLEGPTCVTRGLEEAAVQGAAPYRSRTGPGLGSPPPAKKGSRR